MARRQKTVHPLRLYRIKEKLSCQDVGDMLNLAESTVRSYENGNRAIDADLALKIEKTLGIPREEILPNLFRRRAA